MPSTLLAVCQYHSTSAPDLSSSTCSSYQKNKWEKPGNLQKSNVLAFYASGSWKERLFHIFFSVLAVSYWWPVLDSGSVHVRPTAGKLALRYFLFPTKYFGLSLSLSLHQCSTHIFALRTALKRMTLQHK